MGRRKHCCDGRATAASEAAVERALEPPAPRARRPSSCLCNQAQPPAAPAGPSPRARSSSLVGRPAAPQHREGLAPRAAHRARVCSGGARQGVRREAAAPQPLRLPAVVPPQRLQALQDLCEGRPGRASLNSNVGLAQPLSVGPRTRARQPASRPGLCSTQTATRASPGQRARGGWPGRCKGFAAVA
jgi:hypothetical protein